MDQELIVPYIEFLSQFITSDRLQRFEEVLSNRTRHITMVIEDIYQPQNASAVVRTSECLGLQDIHIIEQNNVYELNKDVVVGASKWIRMHKHKKNPNNTRTCYERLRAAGYKIYATTPNINGYTPDTLPLDEKVAIVLGNEGEGLSATAIEEADGCIQIPMYGFTESYNISVAASIIAYELVQRLHASEIEWQLNEDEKNEIRLRWMKKVLRRVELFESEFYTRRGGKK
ncbi:MAG TPA: rRNA methyltransferase [Flavobacteriales bacterium]|nr:rRNA methyltransferase [Flavobacteriales bacterium]HCA83390.1 rRNA methyltransferase [Flavobacteriales bacterium]HRE74061.1 RNA methyltransferase [Flavobacteriales bacterium]HRE95924.1 RNA methyltransferase [Flavobacteriales bacterium]HRJ34435.1 RNA methyltransferase [Flavobacteriales bacterium]